MQAAPIVLGAQADLSLLFPLSGTPQVTLDSALLTNTFRVPLTVREILFTVQALPDAAPAANVALWNLGGLLQARLATSGRALTNGFVPVWAMCPPLVGMMRSLNLVTGAYQAGSPTEYQTSETRRTVDYNAGNTQIGMGSYFRWVLPQPLVLAPGQAVTGDLRIDPTHLPSNGFKGVTSLDVQATVSLVGAFTAEAPAAMRPVPYASCAIFAPGGPPDNGSADLGNPFAVPLSVQRLTGRWHRAVAAEGVSDDSVRMKYTALTTLDSRRITLRAPGGFAAVSDPTPVDEVFNVHRRAWDVSSVLRNTDDYFQARLVDAMPADTADSVERLHIGLVGSRMERF